MKWHRAAIALEVILMTACGPRAPSSRPAWFASAEAECERGDAAACGRLGDYYGQWPDSYPDQANTHWETACDGGVIASCQRLGGAESDAATRHAWFWRACERGSYDGCLWADRWCDASASACRLPPLLEACELRPGGPCLTAGELIARGGDFDRAIDTARRGCPETNLDCRNVDRVVARLELRIPCAIRTLGDCLDEANRLAASPATVADARDLLGQLCRGDVVAACRRLGQLSARETAPTRP